MVEYREKQERPSRRIYIDTLGRSPQRPTPPPSPERPPVPHTPHKSRKWLVITVITAVILIAAGITGFILYKHRNPYAPLPKNTANLVSFPVYFPVKLPARYHINPKNVSVNSQLISYEITKSGDSSFSLTVNEQALPNNFDFSQLGSKDNNGTPLQTNLGTGYIYTFHDRKNATIVTTTTWLILSGTTQVSNTDIQTITDTLTAVH